MRLSSIIFALVLFLASGCARVSVEAPKEPIKVDISMRLDVYQHIQSDIDAIEDIVSGGSSTPDDKDKQSLLEMFIPLAYAEDGLSKQVEDAALGRRDRLQKIVNLEMSGAIGENRLGFVEIRNASAAGASAEQLLKAENADRMTIYKSLAQKNNTSLEEIQKIYASRLQKEAPAGTPIEVFNQVSGSYEWKIK